MGEAGGLNLYGFVHNNPNYYVDTDGRAAWAITIPGLIGGGVTIGGALAGGAVWITGGAYYWVGGELDEMFGISDGVSDWVTGHNPDGYYPPLALPGSMQPSTPCPTKVDSRAHGKGERNYAGRPDGSGDAFKHMKPDPKDPKKVLFKDPRTGKTKTKPKPPGFDDYWKGGRKNKLN